MIGWVTFCFCFFYCVWGIFQMYPNQAKLVLAPAMLLLIALKKKRLSPLINHNHTNAYTRILLIYVYIYRYVTYIYTQYTQESYSNIDLIIFLAMNSSTSRCSSRRQAFDVAASTRERCKVVLDGKLLEVSCFQAPWGRGYR